MLLNIIHPVNYLLDDCAERDRKLMHFVNRALDAHTKILMHHYGDGNTLTSALQEAILEVYDFTYLLDARIERIATSNYGTPLRDAQPDDISLVEWDALKQNLISHSELQQKIGNASTLMCIGGVLENCLANALDYFQSHIRHDQTLFYTTELCISLNPEDFHRKKLALESHGVKSLTYEEALRLLF